MNDGGYQRVGLLYSFWAAVTKYLTEITRRKGLFQFMVLGIPVHHRGKGMVE